MSHVLAFFVTTTLFISLSEEHTDQLTSQSPFYVHNCLHSTARNSWSRIKGRLMKNKDTMSLRCSLIMEADVMVSNQYDQFCVGGMPEHSVEAAHIVLPVLRRSRQTERQ